MLHRAVPVPGRRSGISAWVFIVLLVLLSFLVVLPFFSFLQRIPEAGSGSSLYIGARILEGKVPYRDFWDFRPPFIFFLNALGLALSRLRLGSWVLEWAAITAAGLMLFRFLKRYFGVWPAGLASVGTILGLTAIENYGNLPEEFALPFQVLTLLLLVQSADRSKDGWRLLALGVAVGLATSLRLTLFGTGLSVTVYLFLTRLYRRDWRGLLNLVWIGAGIGLVWAVWVVYFASMHALPDFLDQVFRYQRFALRVGNPLRIDAVLRVLNSYFYATAFLKLGLISWLAVVPFLLFHDAGFRRLITGRVAGAAAVILGLGLTFNGLYDDASHRFFALAAMSFYRIAFLLVGLLLLTFSGLVLTGRFRRILSNGLRRFQPEDCSGLLLPLSIALVDLPLQIALACLPGQADPAVFLPVFPSAAILVSFLLWSYIPARNGKVEGSIHPAGFGQKNAWLLFAILAFAVVSTGVMTAANVIPPPYNDTEEIADLQTYLHRNAKPEDTILLWSESSQVYLFVSQPPASRYLDQRALFTKGYTTAQKVGDFWEEIRSARPQFIVYSHSWNEPLLIPDEPEQCRQLETESFVIRMQEKDRFRWTDTLAERPFVPAEMRSVYRWICENYKMSAQLGGTRSLEPWFLYRLKQTAP